jgi:2-amino-4-hydroxy-6-hydroxymethyldihydropteridine diphosphokinase
MADGRWQMADGRWQMADGRWQMADGRKRMSGLDGIARVNDGCRSDVSRERIRQGPAWFVRD